MPPFRILGHRVAMACAFAVFALATAPACAAGSNMPWEQPLNQILESIQGPVRRDNQGENPATIRMRMRRRGGDEGRA